MQVEAEKSTSRRPLRFVVAAVVLCALILVAMNQSNTSTGKKMASQVKNDGSVRMNEDSAACVQRLQDVMDKVAFDTPTVSLWNVVPVTSDAVLGYPDEDLEGVASVGQLTGELAKSVPAVNRFDWTDNHKVVQSKEDHVMVYPDNTVVVIDTKKCAISSVWLPSREGKMHPKLESALASRVAVAEDKGNKGPDCSRAFMSDFGLDLMADATQGRGEEGNKFEGDIIASKRELEKFYGRRVRTQGVALAADGLTEHNSLLWTGGVMYWKWGSTITKAAKSDLEWAMNHIRGRVPGVRFVHRSNQRNYVEFVDSSGCSSSVGMRGGRQAINLNCRCGRGAAAHEILHAFGFWHEQSRPDRDRYVNIHWGNIQSGKSHNFQKRSGINSRGSPYDYGSLMHYGSKAFSKNGHATITAKNGAGIGQRNGLSYHDQWQMQAAYPLFVGRRRCSGYYGGRGGGWFSINNFNKKVIRVCGRSGRLVDQIRVQYHDGSWSPSRGGGGGGAWCTSFPSNDNCISEVYIRHGALVDRVQFRTTSGRLSGAYGGTGGGLTVLRGSGGGCLSGFLGRSGSLIDNLAVCFK